MSDRRARPRRRSIRHAAGSQGFTALDLLFALGLAGLLAAIAVPQVHSTVDRSRGLAAARYLASRMALARARAAGGASVALRFEQAEDGIRFGIFGDRNGNGIRSADIAAGVDRRLEADVLLADLFPGVAVALTQEATIEDAVQAGGSNLISFTPQGTATSASVYIRGRDGTRWCVRVLGTTARTRVLRYAPASDSWVQAS